MRRGKLIIEGDSVNAIKWAKELKQPPWKLTTIVREMKAMCSGHEVSFQLSRGQLMEWWTLQRCGWTRHNSVSSIRHFFGHETIDFRGDVVLCFIFLLGGLVFVLFVFLLGFKTLRP